MYKLLLIDILTKFSFLSNFFLYKSLIKMFTLPPWPPKDYILENVSTRHQSNIEFTPSSLPRVTQPNLGKFLYPIWYYDYEKVVPEIKTVHPKIIENWGNKARAWWVDRPAKNAFFLHKLKKECNFSKNNYDPTFSHKENVFYRPFSMEFDCIEYRRLKKLKEKSERENKEKCKYFKKIEDENLLKEQERESIKIEPCNWLPPFWWEYKPLIKNEFKKTSPIIENEEKTEKCLQWQEVPNFFRKTEDPCERKRELLLVGLPFRNEGCNWYYKNQPPPKMTVIPKKFSK